MFKHKHTNIHAMKGNTEATIYSEASGYIAKMNPGKKTDTREHQELQKSAKTTNSINDYNL